MARYKPTKANDFIVVHGRIIDQDKLRKFLKDIRFYEDVEQFQLDDGTWRSPIDGTIFESKFQLYGQLGAYLRTRPKKDPREPTRAGYVRSLRAGVEPTVAQKEAHRLYVERYRKERRQNLIGDKLDEELQGRKVPEMSWE